MPEVGGDHCVIVEVRDRYLSDEGGDCEWAPKEDEGELNKDDCIKNKGGKEDMGRLALMVTV
jgi:hypothetical protein